MSTKSLREQFRAARTDHSLAVLEGFHTLKHALRFEAEILKVVVTDKRKVRDLASDLAPDLIERIEEISSVISDSEFSSLSPRPHPTGVIALAYRPPVDIDLALGSPNPHPAVILHEPRNLANVGASIRVAAAVGVRAVATTGSNDPWDPAALRGSAGLHYALQVGHIDEIPLYEGIELIAIDPSGDPIDHTEFASESILLFGSERYGLSDNVLELADRTLRIPMERNVSSLNLATAVTAVLYSWRIRNPTNLQNAEPVTSGE